MATIPQRQALEVIKNKAEQTPDRFPGYQRELLGALADILQLETKQPYQFVQQISRTIASLGEKLEKAGESNP